MKIFTALCAALLSLAAASCAFAPTDYFRASAQWNAMLDALADEAKAPALAYHNQEHDAARVETLRAGVVAARARLEQRIRTLRGSIEGATYDEAIAERQLRVLDRYSALAALTERVRLGAISGEIDRHERGQIETYALFGEIDWTFAEFMETVPQELPIGAGPIMDAIALDWRTQALNAFARRDVYLGDAPGVATAQRNLRELAPEFRRLAEESEVRRASWSDHFLMSAEERERRQAYIEGAANHMRAHALAIEQLADALTTATPANVDAIPWQSFVERYPPPENEARP